MTAAQEQALAAYRQPFDEAGWRVTVGETGDRVEISAYGGPRAFRAAWIDPEGTIHLYAIG